MTDTKGLDASIYGLFEDLRTLRFAGEKDSPRENLLDVLEVCAVALGAKPAHLNGQGLRSADLLKQLERIASRHRMESFRTHAVIEHQHRLPRIDTQVADWRRRNSMELTTLRPNVLWIYKNRELRGMIELAVSGSEDVAQVLGYPECCVHEELEFHVRMEERYIDALRETHQTRDAAQLIELIRQDTTVDLALEDDLRDALVRVRLAPWREHFPFISFAPCRVCEHEPASPAARINDEMRRLANQLSAAFATELELASRMCLQEPSELPRKVGRNEPCPCGSGKKYKRCHGG